MSLAGARGTTEAELAKVLGVEGTADPHMGRDGLSLALEAPRHAQPDDKGDPVVFADAASLWAQAGFHFQQAFLDALAANYGAGVRLVDFERAAATATDQVNTWVADQTKGRIRHLLDKGAVDQSTRLVLVNAVYFKGSWAVPFDPAQTSDGSFTKADGKRVQVPFMHLDDEFGYAKGPDFQAVRIPYVGGASMVVVLPAPGRLAAVEGSLAPDALQFERAFVDLGLPKFSFSQRESLRDSLAALGVRDAFDADRADFSGMDGDRDLSVADVIHEANISVDEKGTTAAAATGVVMYATSRPVEVGKLTLDRPFLFFVQDDATHEILFLGRVADPTSG
jgi:serpin B